MYRLNFVLSTSFVSTIFSTSAKDPLYILEDDYNAANFFTEGFSFFSGPDPTHGFVDYTDLNRANDSGLAGIVDGNVYLGVDYKTMSPEAGRASTRLESLKTYNKGLFIADIAHMPGGNCGVWPALWTVGSEWPRQGEIDIVEGVNLDRTNSMTLHSSSNCIVSSGIEAPSSVLKNHNCNSNDAYEGCSTVVSDKNSFGTGFNTNRGGVYVMEWTSSTIRIWFFTRSHIPDDIYNSHPNPSLWGLPSARFIGSGCDIDMHFKDHRIIFNTAFCGDWINKVWSSSICAAKAPSCQSYVANNPRDFEHTYWLIKSLKVYQIKQPESIIERKFKA
ncbi:Endo-1,3-beta-glucanase [Golovinomyces cichoracearum]|uniref:endo-1,3(4)-beta-glucanase n=1 Tax=Golovinomyces cichoracearum TaxID=62708 RepID=A0A420I7X1_9PEZI|nr:Endo-1,3-beta-glucanase [Golovinomyces cichoracearum]